MSNPWDFPQRTEALNYLFGEAEGYYKDNKKNFFIHLSEYEGFNINRLTRTKKITTSAFSIRENYLNDLQSLGEKRPIITQKHAGC
mgnify:CR=1 FL=1